jgi:plasmid stabilization system protein ParE
VVKAKLKKLKQDLVERFGEETALGTVSLIMREIHLLADHEELGIDISGLYDVDTPYRYLFSNHNYFIYRLEDEAVVIVNMFHEKEDYMQKLFGCSGRTQESIDYWGELKN